MMNEQMYYDLPMTVTWGDCDAAGISYYAKNFDWFTDARFQFLEHYGFPYMEAFHNQGIYLVCLKAESDYQKMLKPLEKIIVKTSLVSLTRTRMTFSYKLIKENGEVAGEGLTRHAIVSPEGRPFNLQKKFPILWEKLVGCFGEGEI
ncbi:acyl-CoA thioesterase [Pullulanibacillus sp. KACC 23026]|uniref:acyl-CoA thioesterase n=1 Tax=Pullulanibacillus sp. KACC 23026 TaxID=3028315 RepID=UPI0023B11180|nr:acyl-CoA thioesterase [Pullulanibacillus sp. KACC 23026]WEG12353.1 acyl-CoA thioesterase [Pullulanibacillus sp. KACC 23026]